MSSSTSPTQALCLLALVVTIAVTLGTASAAAAVSHSKQTKRTLPGSCLMAASTLCANADTHAMRCLTKLAMKGDARVPTACADALMAGVTVNPRRQQAPRGKRISRLLNEGPACTGANSCPNSFPGSTLRCNDVLSGCSGCAQGTATFTGSTAVVVSSQNTNPNNIACDNICCKGPSGNPACCGSYSWLQNGNPRTSVWCFGPPFCP